MSSKIDAYPAGPWTAAMVATIAAALALRIYGLGSGLWYDEIVTLVASVRLPVAQIVSDFKDPNVHPLYSILAHGTIRLAGESAWALRLPACLFGVASVWMAYVLGTRLVSRAEAWAGATVLATSYHHIWFSQNARGYTMIGFFTLASTLCLLQAIGRGRVRDLAFYALLCAAGVYTHLTMAFVVAGHVVVVSGGAALRWHAIPRGALARLSWAWTGAALLAGAAYAPLLPSLIAHLSSAAPREAAKVATSSWAAGEALRNLLSGSGMAGAIAGALIAGVGGLSLARRHPLPVALLIVPGVVTGAAVVLLHQPLRPRFFFFLSGAAAIFVGRGLGVLADALAARFGHGSHRALTVSLLTCTGLLVAASAVALPRNYELPKQDFTGAMRFLETEESAGARIAVAGPACWPAERYFLKAWPCLTSAAQLRDWLAAPGGTRVLHTLSDYIEDPDLRRDIQTRCGVVRVFSGTLGGGDLVVCDPRQRDAAGPR